jgi:2-dehydropantoate 2-reductase
MSAGHKVTIWGTGAIGGTIGAELARRGEDILLVDAVKPHVERMNAEGLFIEKDRGSFTARVRASLPEEVKSPLGAVFLCVKSHHTPQAAGMVKPLLADQGIVVSLQNGLNEEVIAEQIGRDRTLGALVNFSADYIAPGHIL